MIGPGQTDWFARPDPTGRTTTGERGLRFACTSCGNCCSGAPGYVSFTHAEAEAMAAVVGLPVERFLLAYTHETAEGPSLREKQGPNGQDCVFLDRASVPGKAVCSVYEARPLQCRTWPFWKSVTRSPRTWSQAARNCPGIDTGPLFSPGHVRLTRERLEI